MKKLIPVFALFALALTSVAARAGDNSLIGKALSDKTVSQCVQDARGANTQINASVDVTGICFVSGNTYRVTFTAQPNCKPNEVCPYFARLVATADLGCEGEVISAACYNPLTK